MRKWLSPTRRVRRHGVRSLQQVAELGRLLAAQLPARRAGRLDVLGALAEMRDPVVRGERAGPVYVLHTMRTNIEIDSELVERVMRRYGVPTKRAAVDLALRRLDLESMTRAEALAMRGSGWDGDLDAMRRSWTSNESTAG